ncbi:uncharacterized protein ARMOST_16351 [Armillaria ostoyae]|uniref:DUF6534 domain-containing protein n=1 Tax=Armillaria ostoyae TaxID=47428 RepID=A0A284RVX2_ARMOS|nr:uncharacterized protein ARMOST_16351 [Armillaria ostoyae]
MPSVPTGNPIEEASGPFLVACLLNWGLFGTLSVQLCALLRVVLQQTVSNAFSLDLYYLAFPNDRRFTKYLVYGIYVTEFVQTTLVAHDMFATYGYGFGDIDGLAKMKFHWLTIPIMSAVVACVGQVFYAYRIFILSKSRIIPIFIVCVSLTSSVAAMITGIYAFQAGNIYKLNNRKTYIAAGLMRSNTSFRRTRMLVTKLIRLTIETGSVTAVVALLSFILFITFPHQSFYPTPALLMPKLYANTVYMVLNSRFQIIGGRDTYMSSADMSITTTMMRDITSHPAEGTRPADGMRGQVPVVVMSNEVFDDNYEMGQMSDKPQDSCMSLHA